MASEVTIVVPRPGMERTFMGTTETETFFTNHTKMGGGVSQTDEDIGRETGPGHRVHAGRQGRAQEDGMSSSTISGAPGGP